MIDQATKDRFWSKVEIKGENECWNWKACKKDNKKNNSRGMFFYEGESMTAPRAAYIISNNLQKSQMDNSPVEQTCGNTLCVNPAHLKHEIRDYSKENIFKFIKDNSKSTENGCVICDIKKYHSKFFNAKSLCFEEKYNIVMEANEQIRMICETENCINPEHMQRTKLYCVKGHLKEGKKKTLKGTLINYCLVCVSEYHRNRRAEL